ncbi:MAG: hypothetical protein GXO79_08105 [Chlorobi bacterium]|nr:hypothetical protein [Chlorobiota bacterium]
MKKFSLVLFAFVVAAFISCNKNDDFTYPEATITHFGFDFSAGISDTVNWTNNDGEVISWYPGGGTNPNYESGYWWRNDQNGLSNEQKDFGTVGLSTISGAPADWDTLINPLLAGHSYVVKCQDGYAKIEVLSLSDSDWEAKVKYYFSKTSSFDN